MVGSVNWGRGTADMVTSEALQTWSYQRVLSDGPIASPHTPTASVPARPALAIDLGDHLAGAIAVTIAMSVTPADMA